MYYQINKDEDTLRTEIADANKQIATLKEKLGDHTILSDVPADAKFTDTWVPVQDNLTSESAENALSANQGRILNEKFGGLRLGKNDKGVWGYFVGDFFYPFKQGEALPEQVLNGVTFSNKNESNIVGTMPNNGAVQLSTTGSGNVTIPAGYHNGSGYVSGLGAYNSGRSQGQNDVKNNPNAYGLYSSSQYTTTLKAPKYTSISTATVSGTSPYHPNGSTSSTDETVNVTLPNVKRGYYYRINSVSGSSLVNAPGGGYSEGTWYVYAYLGNSRYGKSNKDWKVNADLATEALLVDSKSGSTMVTIPVGEETEQPNLNGILTSWHRSSVDSPTICVSTGRVHRPEPFIYGVQDTPVPFTVTYSYFPSPLS